MRIKLFLICALLLLALPVTAQDSVISDDQVNDIAKKLYCPVCENIPLDTCATAACQDWRYEIRLQLESGMTETEIVNDFVRRFGDRVVGTPQDPILRTLSLLTPWLLAAFGAIAVAMTLLRWHSTAPKRSVPSTNDTFDVANQSDAQDRYRSLLEQDLGEV